MHNSTRINLSYGDHHAIKDHKNEQQIFRVRLFFMLGFILLLFLVLLYRFYDLQVHSHTDYSTLSDRNRIQVRPVAPNRGLILDATGKILAGNRAVQTLSLVRERLKDEDETIAELSKIIEISDREIESYKKASRLRLRPYEAVPLKYNLNEEELAKLAVNEFAFNGVEVQGHLVRHYPSKEMFSHVVGYVGRINESELREFNPEQIKQYSGTQSIGKIGIEKYYESVLLGGVGQESIETDARGRVLRVLKTQNPTAGAKLDLYLREDVQQKSIELMDGRRGAVVAIDIKSGGVLAMASTPSFDPNLFVIGISEADFSELNTSRDLPLYNRTIQGQYPPGSTVKPMLGLAALAEGVTTAQAKIADPGYYQLENDERLYREWKRGGHGASVDLHEAIVESCDIFFYDIGFRMGVDRMHPAGTMFGLGSRSNIDIPSEKSGLWPSREWKKNVRGLNWYPGNSLNMSIGQGDVLATPLQLATMTATIARRGELVEPRIVQRINDEPTQRVVRGVYEVDGEHWDLVINSMRDVWDSPHGTAHSVAKNMRYSIAGKTGTAQVVSIAQDEEYDSEALSERNRDHALFVAFAPVEDPQIAISVVIENGEKSSQAALVAKAVIEYYLSSKE